MERREVDGYFWLPNSPDTKIAGQLAFGGLEPAELHLIGAFHPWEDFDSINEHPIRFNGITESKYVTLDDCRLTRQKNATTELSARERYHVTTVLVGARFEDTEPLEFRSVAVELQYLELWVARTGMTHNIVQGDGPSLAKHIDIRYTPIDTLTLSADIGEIQLSFPYDFGLSTTNTPQIKHRCALRVQFNEPRSLDDVLKICSALQNLVTIGVNATSHVVAVGVTHFDLSRTLPSGREIFEPIQIYAHYRGDDGQQLSHISHPDQMIFTFDNIGGLQGIANWLTLSNRFAPVIIPID